MSYGDVAQLARAHGSYPWCRGFKSLRRYHIDSKLELFEKILKRLIKKSFLCYCVYRYRNLHKILKEHLISAC